MTVNIVFAHPATGQNYDTLEAAAAVFPGVTLATLGEYGLVQTSATDTEVNLNTGFSTVFGSSDHVGVLPTPMPVYDPITQMVREIDPALDVLDRYVQAWEVVDLDAEHVAANRAQQAAAAFAAVKAARLVLVEAITVTTAAGHTFDGDEDSQNRMSRAIAGMDDGDTTLWVLTDNSLITVGRAELREALRLSGIEMTTIWMSPYQ